MSKITPQRIVQGYVLIVALVFVLKFTDVVTASWPAVLLFPIILPVATLVAAITLIPWIIIFVIFRTLFSKDKKDD